MTKAPKPSTLPDTLERVVSQHGPRVRAAAASLVRRLPANVEREDLVQDGMVGLMEAMVRWTRAANGAHFEHYIAKRSQGAMLDGLRALDPASRSLRTQMRAVEKSIQRLAHGLGRLPRESEVAQALDMPLAAYQTLLQQADGYKLLSLDDLETEADSPDYLRECARRNADPLVVLERSAFRQGLAQALAELDVQEQTVLHLYYGEGLRMHEIGAELGVVESRVSQLHAHAIAKLRAALQSPEARFSMLKPRVAPR